VGKGVLGLERRKRRGEQHLFDWSGILKRKQALALELEADWFIHHDADEFRESPWLGITLAEAITRVDQAGWNAVDFAALDFWPVTEQMATPRDIREAFAHCEPTGAWNYPQIKCWKRTTEEVDLVSSGGHEAIFTGRRVCPIRFLLRHYPIRGTAHGHRKVFAERIPRFSPEDRSRGWHVQYDRFTESPTFIREASTLSLFHPERVRMTLMIEDIATLAGSRDTMARDAAALDAELRAQRERGVMLAHEVTTFREDLAAAATERQALTDALEAERRVREEINARAQLAQATADAALERAGQLEESLRSRSAELVTMSAERDQLSDQVRSLYGSRTWRWTRPARWLIDAILGRPRSR
jgi:hypothetical protein